MVGQTEHEEQSTTPESEKSGGRSTQSNAALAHMLFRMKLKLVANYVMDGFIPAVAVIALIVAVMAINSNKSGLDQLGKNTATIDSMSANLLASNLELKKLKATIAAEKSMQEQENNKQNEMMKKIILNVSQLQLKMKISPTLEQQLSQPASASAATPSVALPVPLIALPLATTPAAGVDKKHGKQ